MNPSSLIISRKDIERYVLRRLREIFWKFPGEISLGTTFRELERYHDLDLLDQGLLFDLEEDLGVELSDEEVQQLDAQGRSDVAGLVDVIARHVTELH